MAVLHFDDETEHARWAIDLQHRDGLANPTELITIRVEYADTGESGDEHPIRAHDSHHPQLLTRAE